MYFKRFILSLFAIVALQSCNSDDDSSVSVGEENASTFASLSELINFNNVKTDTLSFNPNQSSQVVGSEGTKINIPAGAVMPDASGNLPDQLFVLIREYPTVSAMVKSGVQTVSNGSLLVTGGNFWWNIIDEDGNSWDVNSYQISAEQPIKIDMGEYAPEALAFWGEEITVGDQETVNWGVDEFNEEFFYGDWEKPEYYDVFEYYSMPLGWINCDAFFDYEGERVDVKATIKSDVDLRVNGSKVFFIPKDIPSAVNGYISDSDIPECTVSRLPENMEGTIMVLSLDENNKLLLGYKEITVQKDVVEEVEMNYSTQEEFNDLVDALTAN